MCGRFARKTKPKPLAQKFKVKVPDDTLFEWEPKYNVAPTTLNPIFRMPTPGEPPVMESFKWGFSTPWNPHAVIANARAETIADKPTFAQAFRAQRCLVPVDGYYEWNPDTKPKQPHYYFLKNKEPFCLAALWRKEENKQDPQKPIYTFTLITTQANSLAAKVHDRMPVILDEKQFPTWLDPQNHDEEGLLKMLKPYAPAKMDSYPVSTYVSNSRNEGPECLEKAASPKAPAPKTKSKKKSDDGQMGLSL